MIRMNSKMKKLLTSNIGNDRKNLAVKLICEKIIAQTKQVKNCIIYDKENEIKEEKLDEERILKINGDWTGYEVACNEIVFGEDVFLGDNTGDSIECILNEIKLGLINKYGDRQFCVIIAVNKYSTVMLRFHTYREEEGVWLSQNLEGYENAVLYEIF